MLSDMDRPYGLVALPTECPEGVYFNISCAGLSFIKFNFIILQMRKIYLHLTNLIFSAKSTCQRGQDFGGNDCERDQLCLPDGLGSYKCVCGDQDINCIVHK